MNTRRSEPVAVRMPEDVLAGVDEIATILDRKRSWVIVRALRQYLAAEGKHLSELAAARKEASKGDLVEADALLHEFADDLPLYRAGGR